MMNWLFILLILTALTIAVIVIVRAIRSSQSGGIELKRVQDQLLSVQIEHAKSEQLAAGLEAEKHELKNTLMQEREHNLTLERSLESTRSFYEAQLEKFEEQKNEIAAIKKQFNTEFQLLANKILEDKSQKFSEENSKALDLILNPLHQKLKNFEEKIEKTYAFEAAERNSLKGVVLQLMEQSAQIKDEANNLAKALKGDNKKQGNWGEIILERVLERSGLTKGQEFRLQVSVMDELGRRLQPDAIIDLPEGKHLVIDSKVSLVAYEQWVNAETPEQQAEFAKQHIVSVENHIKELSAKNYHELYGIDSPEFVLLFMPVESALSMSVAQKPEIFSDAWDRKVVIVSPSTLLATLRTIASIWKQERQTRNVIEIAKEAGSLYDKFVGFVADLEQVKTYMERGLKSHEEAMKKLSFGPGNLVNRVEKLKRLGAKANKQIDSKFLDDPNS